MKPITLFALFIFALLSTSCITKKKFKATLEVERQEYENRMASLDYQILQKNQQIDTFRTLYAETRGANEALLATQDKHLDRIDAVQLQLENVKKAKSSTTQDLNFIVQEKEQIIADKDEQLRKIKSVIDRFENDQVKIINEFKGELAELFAEKQAVDYKNNEIHITYDESLLFRPASARVRTIGIENLQKIADLMNKNPTLKLYVIGNTDNKTAKNYKDNWDYSVIRASNVVKILVGELGLSPNRVIAAGKGAFSPKASNETPDGQAANRRIDFVILPRLDRVLKAVKKEVE